MRSNSNWAETASFGERPTINWATSTKTLISSTICQIHSLERRQRYDRFGWTTAKTDTTKYPQCTTRSVYLSSNTLEAVSWQTATPATTSRANLKPNLRSLFWQTEGKAKITTKYNECWRTNPIHSTRWSPFPANRTKITIPAAVYFPT